MLFNTRNVQNSNAIPSSTRTWGCRLCAECKAPGIRRGGPEARGKCVTTGGVYIGETAVVNGKLGNVASTATYLLITSTDRPASINGSPSHLPTSVAPAVSFWVALCSSRAQPKVHPSVTDRYFIVLSFSNPHRTTAPKWA